MAKRGQPTVHVRCVYLYIMQACLHPLKAGFLTVNEKL